MKKIFAVISIMLVSFMLFGCKTDSGDTNQTAIYNQTYDRTGTIQGKVMNALTGAALGNDVNSELLLWLIQGTDNRTPNKLITDNNNPLVGEYAFSGIPVSLVAGESKFKIVAVKKGFQRFEAEVTLNANFDANSTLDAVINMIGDIYLFPLNASAGDVTVTVKNSHGEVVPNAVVLLQQDVSNNNDTAIVSSYRLNPIGGLYTSLSGTTNSSGVVTFTGANLVLGGAYIAIAEGMNYGGEQLATETGTMFRVGVNSQDQRLTMSPPALPGALYATSISNSIPGEVKSSGVLTITFNQPIFLTTTTFNATLSVVTGSAGVLNTPNATGVLTDGGKTLTITPSFASAASTTANTAAITYSYAGTIYLDAPRVASGVTFNGTPATDLVDFNGIAVSRKVQLTPVQ